MDRLRQLISEARKIRFRVSYIFRDTPDYVPEWRNSGIMHELDCIIYDAWCIAPQVEEYRREYGANLTERRR